MPKRRTLDLTPEQYQELVDCRDHHRLPYLRERAAALLLIAAGLTPAYVAKYRLLRPRDPDTVYAWLKRYQQEGLAGLVIRKGRGRKPAFSQPIRMLPKHKKPSCMWSSEIPTNLESTGRAGVCQHYFLTYLISISQGRVVYGMSWIGWTFAGCGVAPMFTARTPFIKPRESELDSLSSGLVKVGDGKCYSTRMNAAISFSRWWLLPMRPAANQRWRNTPIMASWKRA